MLSSGYLSAFGAAITWGLVYAIDEKILAGVSPVSLVFIDSCLMALFMLPFILINRGFLQEVSTATKLQWPLMIVAVLLALGANFLILSAIKLLGASNASIIEIAYPFFVVLFSFIMFRAVPNAYFFLGGSLIFIGSLILMKFAS